MHCAVLCCAVRCCVVLQSGGVAMGWWWVVGLVEVWVCVRGKHAVRSFTLPQALCPPRAHHTPRCPASAHCPTPPHCTQRCRRRAARPAPLCPRSARSRGTRSTSTCCLLRSRTRLCRSRCPTPRWTATQPASSTTGAIAIIPSLLYSGCWALAKLQRQRQWLWLQLLWPEGWAAVWGTASTALGRAWEEYGRRRGSMRCIIPSPARVAVAPAAHAPAPAGPAGPDCSVQGPGRQGLLAAGALQAGAGRGAARAWRAAAGAARAAGGAAAHDGARHAAAAGAAGHGAAGGHGGVPAAAAAAAHDGPRHAAAAAHGAAARVRWRGEAEQLGVPVLVWEGRGFLILYHKMLVDESWQRGVVHSEPCCCLISEGRGPTLSGAASAMGCAVNCARSLFPPLSCSGHINRHVASCRKCSVTDQVSVHRPALGKQFVGYD